MSVHQGGRNTTLTQLELYDNSIGDDGARALATALERNTTLTQLNLGRNSIGDDGKAAIRVPVHTPAPRSNKEYWRAHKQAMQAFHCVRFV